MFEGRGKGKGGGGKGSGVRRTRGCTDYLHMEKLGFSAF